MNLEDAIKLLLQKKVLVDEHGRFWQECGRDGVGSVVQFLYRDSSEDFWVETTEFPRYGWRLATPEEEASL